ncbi:Polyprotein [Phytophthora palmivora]|uniref:Polyprotein n=1 Tax=Phytophthora palmivora TaxID=4796 RepID=A0A2P4YM41_9STRA|nr:Polyprotein [Phytophthora palmivora]
MKDFLDELKTGEIAEMVVLRQEITPEDLNSSSVMDEDVLEGFTKQRATRLGSEILKNLEDPVYPLVKEYSDVVSKHPPSQLPPDRGVRHEVDLVPGTKYCVTRQWPLPREQCEVIDAFFADKAKSDMVRESKSPHSKPTFCVRKPNGQWRLVHAYNKLNNTMVPAQTPIPRKDTYFDDIFVHSRADDGQTAMAVHLKHLRRVFKVMRANKLYANIDKCVFAAEEIKVLGCFVSRVGHQDAFDSIKASLQQVPVLALSNENKSFSVKDDGGRERVISFQSRQLKAAERNYPVHDKELLAMKSARSDTPCVSRDENDTPLVRFLSDGKDAKVDRLSPRQRAQLHRYELAEGLLDPRDPPRVVVPNDEDLKYDILLEAHDAPISGHLGREKTYQMVSQTFWWPRMYKWVAHYVRTCETCQRMEPSGHASAPLQSLPVPADCWKSMSLDSVFGLPTDDKGNTGILVFVYRLSKMVHLAPVRDKITGKQAAQLFLDSVFRYHGLPETIVSDRDPRFTGAFWDTLFQLLGTKLTMSTADHPQTDGQTECVNRVLEDTLRSICAEAPRSWSDQLPMVEFALNNVVHASTGFTPFYLNGLRHPRCR